MGQMYYRANDGTVVPISANTASPIQEGLDPATGANGMFFYDTDATTATTISADTANAQYANRVGSTTDNAVTRFDGVTGSLQNSGVTIDDSNAINGVASIKHTSAASANLTLNSDGTTVINPSVQTTARNKIINGSFAVDQRNSGGTQTITAGAALAYTADRWYAYCTGANVTGQRLAGSAPFQYYYRFTGATSNTAVGFGTRLEAADTYHMAGQTATLSVYAASSALTSLTWTAYYANSSDTFGTLASPTRTQIATGTFTLNSTVSRKVSAPISIPAGATTGMEIVFTSGALLGSQTLTFAGAQLELGSAATPFEFEPIATTVYKCFRYFQKLRAWTGVVAIANSVIDAQFQIPVEMRATPSTPTAVSGSSLRIRYANNDVTYASFSLANYSGSNTSFFIQFSGTFVIAQGTYVFARNTNTEYLLNVSAEL